MRARIQAEIDSIRSLFTETVAAGRGHRLSAEAALATEAECYRGAEAVAAGLADEVSDPASAFAAFADAVNGRAAAPGRTRRTQLTKELKMKPNAMIAAADPATDPIEDQTVPVPAALLNRPVFTGG